MCNSMTIHEAIQEYHDNELLHYLQEEFVENNEKHKEVMQMYPHDTGGHRISSSSLQLTLELDKSKEVIFKLIDIGGFELRTSKFSRPRQNSNNKFIKSPPPN